MTIDPNSLRTTQTGVQPGTTEKAQQRRIESLYSGRPEREGGAVSSGDRAQLSELSRNLRLWTADSPERAAHLEQLAEQVEARRYEVDPRVVSERLVEESLRASV